MALVGIHEPILPISAGLFGNTGGVHGCVGIPDPDGQIDVGDLFVILVRNPDRAKHQNSSRCPCSDAERQ